MYCKLGLDNTPGNGHQYDAQDAQEPNESCSPTTSPVKHTNTQTHTHTPSLRRFSDLWSLTCCHIYRICLVSKRVRESDEGNTERLI